MPKLSISQLAAFTGKDRRTITDRLEALDFIDGPDNAHLYETDRAFELIYLGNGESGPMSLEQAKKEQDLSAAELNRARREELERKRIPIGIPLAANDQALQAVGNTLKAAKNRKLTPALINDLLAKLRAIPAQLDVSKW